MSGSGSKTQATYVPTDGNEKASFGARRLELIGTK
jgi:hypothetical protein